MADRRTLMIVHAHPDDEVFSTGGIIAKHAARGDRVVVVYGTRGEEGEMHDPDLVPEEAMPRLGEIREGELRRAAEILGITDLHFLGYRDSGMADTEANQNPSNFHNAPLDEAVDRLLAIMRETGPQVLVTYDEEGGYGHPDHIKANRVTTEAFRRARGEDWAPRKLYYAARSREGFRHYAEGIERFGTKIPWLKGDFNFDEYGTPDADITAHIDVTQYAPLKRQALSVHRTQIKPDSFFLRIPDEALAELQGVEYFVRIEPPHQAGERETDLFAGIDTAEAAA